MLHTMAFASCGHVVGGNDVLISGRRHEDVEGIESLLDGDDVDAVHAGLKGADWGRFGDGHLGLLAFERLNGALSNVAETTHQSALPTDHDVGRRIMASTKEWRHPYTLSNLTS